MVIGISHSKSIWRKIKNFQWVEIDFSTTKEVCDVLWESVEEDLWDEVYEPVVMIYEGVRTSSHNFNYKR